MSIKQVTTYKYLGVVLDETLSYNNHASKTIKSASHKLSLLRRVRPLLTTEAALQIYKSMILPVIEYGNILYDTACKKLTNKLQIIQNKCLKVVHKKPKLTPSSEIHRLSKIKPLRYRRLTNLLIHAYKRSWVLKYRDNRKIPTRTFATRNLKCPNSKKSQTQNSIAYRTASAWNRLESSIRDQPSLSTYKKQITNLKVLKQLDWTRVENNDDNIINEFEDTFY